MKRRIVIVLSSFPQLSESFIVNKVFGLINNGWDIHIVCTNSSKKEWKNFPQFNHSRDISNRVHLTMPVRPIWWVMVLFPIILLSCLIKNPLGCIRYLSKGFNRYGISILKRFYIDSQVISLRPDIIHFEFGTSAINRQDINYLLGCKVLVSFRGFDLNFSGLDKPGYYDSIWYQCDGFHFLGKDLYNRALKRGWSGSKPSVLIPPAIDVSFFNPELVNKQIDTHNGLSQLHILSVGRLEWKKGYEFGLQAIRMLIDQGIKCEYHILGGGSYLEPLAFAVHQLGLDNIVSFLGPQSQSYIRDKLGWADIFLHSAVSEGFCNSVMEAQAMTIPVVCTDADGLPENVQDGLTGFIVPRRNPQELTEKLEKLARSPSLRQSMGLAGRKRVVELFSLSTQITRFDNFYHQLLENHAN